MKYSDKQASSLAGWKGRFRGNRAEWLRVRVLGKTEKRWSLREVMALTFLKDTEGMTPEEVKATFEAAMARDDAESRARLSEVEEKGKRYISGEHRPAPDAGEGDD